MATLLTVAFTSLAMLMLAPARSTKSSRAERVTTSSSYFPPRFTGFGVVQLGWGQRQAPQSTNSRRDIETPSSLSTGFRVGVAGVSPQWERLHWRLELRWGTSLGLKLRERNPAGPALKKPARFQELRLSTRLLRATGQPRALYGQFKVGGEIGYEFRHLYSVVDLPFQHALHRPFLGIPVHWLDGHRRLRIELVPQFDLLLRYPNKQPESSNVGGESSEDSLAFGLSGAASVQVRVVRPWVLRLDYRASYAPHSGPENCLQVLTLGVALDPTL